MESTTPNSPTNRSSNSRQSWNKSEFSRLRLKAEKARRRFRDFIPLAWGIVEPARPFLPNWHIDAIADHLQAVAEGQITRLVINIPPGHAKSLLVSVLWPAWMWIRDPKWRALFASYAAELAIRDSVRCRSLIESEWYGEMFRPDWTLATDQNTKALFENTEKGFRISLGVGGKGTGYRGDAIVVDDALNAKEAFSDAALDECAFWWDQVMSSRLNDPATGAKVIMMQRLNERDLCGHVLERGGYEQLRLPSEYELETHCRTKIGFQDPRTTPGELLFPALFTREVIEQAKIDLGTTAYEAQHQQRPSPIGGGMLKRHWWRFWQPKGAGLPPVAVRLPEGSIEQREAVELPAEFDQLLQSWDMSFKATGDSSFVVGKVHAAKGANRYLLDQVRDRWDFPGTLLQVRMLSARWPKAYAKLVEDKANGPAVVQSLRHEIAGLIEVKPEGEEDIAGGRGEPTA